MPRRPFLPCLFAPVCLTLPAGPSAAHPGGHDSILNEDAEPVAYLAAPLRVGGQTPRVEITERDGYRHITSNGLPDHTPGSFPNRGNPHTITPQRHRFRVTLDPQPARSTPRRPTRALFGVALNGVPFDPGTAEVWSPTGRTQMGRSDAPSRGSTIWRYEALTGKINLGLDRHHAHVQPDGTYHYHALPTGLYERLAGRPVDRTPDAMVLLGYAADGYPIYGVYGHRDADDPDSPLTKIRTSYRLKPGARPTGSSSPGGRYDGRFTDDWEYVAGRGDLDEHNGRTGVTPGYPDGTYHYVLTEDFPFVPRTFHGTPDESFLKARGQRGERRGPPPLR
ncbi:MAG: YHYH protein [Planctomycetota bacterium]